LTEKPLAHRVLKTERRMIRREYIEQPFRQSVPNRLLVEGIARSRTANIFGPFETGLVKVVGGEKQILRARLSVDLQTLSTCPADLLNCFCSRDMHQQDWSIDQFRERDGSMRRFAFNDRWARRCVIFGCCVPGLLKFFDQPFD